MEYRTDLPSTEQHWALFRAAGWNALPGETRGADRGGIQFCPIAVCDSRWIRLPSAVVLITLILSQKRFDRNHRVIVLEVPIIHANDAVVRDVLFATEGVARLDQEIRVAKPKVTVSSRLENRIHSA